MSVTQRLRIAGFLLNITEWDRHLEVVRQILNGIDSFEPYEAYRRITRGKTSIITLKEVDAFLRENSVAVDGSSLEVVLRLYDTKFLGGLDFEDFLKLTLARDNPSTRFDAAARREIHEISPAQSLAEEVEYTLARLLSKACDFVKRMKIDAESQSILSERDLFGQLVSVSVSTSILDFKNLKRFFESLKILPKDSEIIAILRVIDINDDGSIDRSEFEYFVSLFSHRSMVDTALYNRLKERARRSHNINYFGERVRGEEEPKSITSSAGGVTLLNYNQRVNRDGDGEGRLSRRASRERREFMDSGNIVRSSIERVHTKLPVRVNQIVTGDERRNATRTSHRVVEETRIVKEEVRGREPRDRQRIYTDDIKTNDRQFGHQDRFSKTYEGSAVTPRRSRSPGERNRSAIKQSLTPGGRDRELSYSGLSTSRREVIPRNEVYTRVERSSYSRSPERSREAHSPYQPRKLDVSATRRYQDNSVVTKTVVREHKYNGYN